MMPQNECNVVQIHIKNDVINDGISGIGFITSKIRVMLIKSRRMRRTKFALSLQRCSNLEGAKFFTEGISLHGFALLQDLIIVVPISSDIFRLICGSV